MAESDTDPTETDIALWAEYYYSEYYGYQVYIPPDFDFENLTDRQLSIVPYQTTQHGFLRITPQSNGLLHIFNPALARARENPAYWLCHNERILTNKVPCMPNANHSETCFIDWINKNKDRTGPKLELFTNSSPCCVINNSNTRGTLNHPGCTEALITFCQENKDKEVHVFFYRYYKPQGWKDKQNRGNTLQAAETAYTEFLKNKRDQKKIPNNLKMFKIKMHPRNDRDAPAWVKNDKWKNPRNVANEGCKRIL